MYKNQNILISFIMIIGIVVIILIMAKAFTSPAQQAKNAVQQFYSFEQQGEFASSWMLFHPSMKEIFKKGPYIQDRAHVFMNHFGVETFTYTLSKPEKIKNWRMSSETEALHFVYKITVIQTYQSKYGKFHIHQDVYATKENNQWYILWDYNF